MKKRYFRVNLYKGSTYNDDIEISYSYSSLRNALREYNQKVEQYKDILIELIAETQEGIIGECFTLLNNVEPV